MTNPMLDTAVVFRYVIISAANTPKIIANRTKVPPNDTFNLVFTFKLTLDWSLRIVNIRIGVLAMHQTLWNMMAQ
jgi:hypothetical protein